MTFIWTSARHVWPCVLVLFSFSSFAHPPAIYRYDLKTGATLEWARVEAPSMDARSIKVAQGWYPSRDGTRVFMFLVHRKGIKLDGDNPTLLYGYGGFNVAGRRSSTATFITGWSAAGATRWRTCAAAANTARNILALVEG
jgi:prolyl oligopeptidase